MYIDKKDVLGSKCTRNIISATKHFVDKFLQCATTIIHKPKNKLKIFMLTSKKSFSIVKSPWFEYKVKKL